MCSRSCRIQHGFCDEHDQAPLPACLEDIFADTSKMVKNPLAPVQALSVRHYDTAQYILLDFQGC